MDRMDIVGLLICSLCDTIYKRALESSHHKPLTSLLT